MTRQEFIEKYGDVMVTFSSYYKFSFTYSAMLPTGERLSVSYGGTSDDIYRFSVTAGEQVRVVDLEPYSGMVWRGNEELDSFYDL